MCNVHEINVPAKQENVFTRPWIVNKFNGVQIFSSGLDKSFIGAGVAIIMDNSLARYVSKVEEVSSRIVSVRLLFKGKLLVTLLSLYAGAFSGARFGQTSEVNSLIAKAINSSTHVVLGGNFNENGSGKSTSFKFCLGLGLVNSFSSHYSAGSHTWNNSRGVVKTINYIFVSGSLSSAVADHQTVSVSDFFDTNHRAVMVSIGLSGLLNVQLNSLHKQMNRDRWKFKFKNADNAKWAKFRDLSSAKLLLLGDVFSGAEARGDEAVVEFADEMFSKHWFSKFKGPKNKHSSKFFGLELLVAKIVKKFCSGGLSDVNLLVSKWLTLDNAKTCAFSDLVSSGVKSDVIVKHLSLICRDYRRAKMFESRFAKETSIRKAINRHMDNFCSEKSSMIRSVLDRPFHKVVLDHLVVDDELVLEPKEVKMSVDKIIEGWTRKNQYMHYVQDDVFSGVMYEVDMDELLSVVSGLFDGKATGLSGIPNELWKHDGEVVLGCMLALFNVCLTAGVVPVLWKKVWKILSKILSDCISVACSKFNILQSDNFLVLKGMSTQSPVFAVGSHHLKASLQHIKMCEKFIRFFSGIHEDRVNRVMTDFGLSDGYKDEVFSPLLWRIFYDLLLCEVKRHEQLCEYWIDTKFVSKTGRIEGGSGLTLYFLAGTFVDDTIWVGNCQTSTQYALNIASEFFMINDISINSEKTVVILINQGVKIAKLSICGQSILIAKKGKANHYLGIFLSTERLSKLSIAKAHADVHFFVNVVLRKAIMDKQFLYLVSAVLQPIVNYRIEFSFVSSNVCRKWDALVRKGLKSKACLPHDFSNAALHYSLFYGLKLFEQRLDPHGSVPHWFVVSSEFLKSKGFSSSGSADPVVLLGLDILGSGEFSAVRDGSHDMWLGFFEVFMDGSLKNFGSAGIVSGTAAYFLALDLSVGIAVQGFLSSTMAELQAVVLSLECVPSSNTVVVHLNSQTAIDAYFSVSWVKIKSHSGVSGNVEADLAAGAISGSPFSLLAGVCKHFLVAEDTPVSGNACYFVRNIFYSVCCAHWEAGLGFDVVLDAMIVCINWVVIAMRLPVAVRKKLYDRCYPGVLCLLCGGVEFSNHSFTCTYESGIRDEILAETSAHWSVLADASSFSASTMLWVLFQCSVDVGLYTLICKGFVLNEWYKEACSVFNDKKVAVARITNFVRFVVELHHAKMWLVRSNHRVKMEKTGLVHNSSVISGLAYGVSLVLSNGVVRLLGLAESFAVCFGC
ncbi:hypothetical protein G9A89_002810 [Geosiphon pyriformis]|nr:hypothetical protein G9A89_002810 [Geosiphon pyriformis]